MSAALRAISDLHVSHAGNGEVLERVVPTHPDDWLIVAGDVSERIRDVVRVLARLRERFARVIWTPGNHELWTSEREGDRARGVERYDELVARVREVDVLTPEDPYPVWDGDGGPVRVAPLFVPYDFTWLAPGTQTPAESRDAAYAAGIVCTDEVYLHPDPYPSIVEWSADRVARTQQRLDASDLPLVLVNHWPLHREPTRVMTHQVFVQWCGTQRTADWHTRYPVVAVVHGHLHIPRRVVVDDVPFEEVSIGYPREWRRFGLRADLARQILPRPVSS